MNLFAWHNPSWSDDSEMWFSFAIMYTITNAAIVVVYVMAVRIFNPSGFKEKIQENAKVILPHLVYGAFFGWAAFGLSFTGCPMPGMFTFIFSVVIALIVEGILDLRKDEKEAKNKQRE